MDDSRVSLALIPIFAALLLSTLAKAKAMAQHVQCINNLKQIGLAARVWASDRGDRFPQDFEAMSAALASHKPSCSVAPFMGTPGWPVGGRAEVLSSLVKLTCA